MQLLKKLEGIVRFYGFEMNNGKTEIMVTDRKNITRKERGIFPGYETVKDLLEFLSGK